MVIRFGKKRKNVICVKLTSDRVRFAVSYLFYKNVQSRKKERQAQRSLFWRDMVFRRIGLYRGDEGKEGEK